mmetsp:Transcript_40952/g.65841  ORF Transcript_40952/g.65841 Transcript_40952/m.65841 type:complete len:524 (-) Transcript_40952:55-1626(-)
MATNDDDTLKLAQNVQCQKMLSKMGDNFPEQERVVLSMKLIKINKRGKEQNRILLLTDKALYNLKPKEIRKCQRRIDLEKIVSITVSGTSQEFAIHIPEEYDYRYKSKQKERIATVLAELYKRKEGKKLAINRISQDSMLAVTVTKDVARLQTREQRLRRYQELIGKDNYDDEINDAAQAKVTGQLIESKEKVKPDDFEFLKVIGRGSFGKVMQVRKKDTGELFAMKILKKKALIAKHQVEHTNAERRILAALQHPFLMRLRFAFQTAAKLYFILDFCAGGELFFHLKKKRRFPEIQARFFVAETAMALGHLHTLDVVYRDLKPENILLQESGHIVLTDFGLSKFVDAEEQAHTFCGTPEYLAPEIVTNLGHGKPVDWWALGILLYELTVGIPPFYSQNVNEMYRKIQEAPLLFPPNLTSECKSLISQLLNRNPKERLGSSRNDVEDIMRHPFFKDLDWQKLYRKEIMPPFKPQVKDVDDYSNWDDVFTKENVVDSHVKPPELGASQHDGFEGFEYAPRPSLI